MCEWTDIGLHDTTVRNLAGGGANCRASLRDSRPISYMVFYHRVGLRWALYARLTVKKLLQLVNFFLCLLVLITALTRK